MRACSSCHSTATVIQHRDTAAGWANEVDTMVARGAMLSTAEESQVVAYLAQHYPSGTPPSPRVSEQRPTARPCSRPARAASATPTTADCTARPCALLEGRYPVGAETRRSLTGAGADWPSTNLDPAPARSSLLAQINVKNVGQLKEAWTWESNPKFPRRS